MTEYSYKVRMEQVDCFVPRLVPFHDNRFLRFEQVQKVAEKHLTSQTCPECGKNHKANSYVVTDVERGEPDNSGGFYYRDVMPGDNKAQMELGL